jgi:hypothetical protein
MKDGGEMDPILARPAMLYLKSPVQIDILKLYVLK